MYNKINEHFFLLSPGIYETIVVDTVLCLFFLISYSLTAIRVCNLICETPCIKEMHPVEII